MQYIGRLSRMGGRLYLGIPKELQSQAVKLLKKDLRIDVTEIFIRNDIRDVDSKVEDKFLGKVAKEVGDNLTKSSRTKPKK